MLNRNKKIILLLLSILLFSLVGCENDKNSSSVYQTKDGKIGFLINGYSEVQQDVFDLQCKNEENAFMSVFSYNIKNFDASISKKDVLDLQIEDLMSKRKDPQQEGEIRETNLDDKTIYRKVYTATKDENRFMYSFYVIDFKEIEDNFALVIFSSDVVYGQEHLETYDEILATAEIFK